MKRIYKKQKQAPKENIPKPVIYNGEVAIKCNAEVNYLFDMAASAATGGVYLYTASAGGLIGLDSSTAFNSLAGAFDQYKGNWTTIKVILTTHWGSNYETDSIKSAMDPDGDLTFASTNAAMQVKHSFQEHSARKEELVLNYNSREMQYAMIGGAAGWQKVNSVPAKTPNVLIRIEGFNIPNGVKVFSLRVTYYVQFRDLK